jgi:hypothetical protein
MRKIAPSFGQILLCAISLFFLGPQFGSLDIDGDGIPDVPVIMVMGGNSQNVQPAHSDDGQTKVGLATASPFLGLKSRDIVFMKRRIVVEPRGSRLDSVVPLLC